MTAVQIETNTDMISTFSDREMEDNYSDNTFLHDEMETQFLSLEVGDKVYHCSVWQKFYS